MLIGIGSAYRRAGLMYQKWKDHYGKPGDDVLVIHAKTRDLSNHPVNTAAASGVAAVGLSVCCL